MTGFLIGEDERAIDRVDHRVGDFSIRVDGKLPAALYVSPSGECVCLLLGWPIDPVGTRLLEGRVEITEPVGDIAGFHARYVEPLLGSYIAIVALGGEQRVYLDGLGTLSLVYEEATRRAASAASQLFTSQEYEARFDRKLHASLEVEEDGWFPAGLTAHRGVERLLANHYLDLSTWQQVRHQDYRMAAVTQDIGASLDILGEQCRTMVQALLHADQKVALGLTGGGDSRLLLAALRPLVAEIEFYTVAPPEAKFDLVRAGELAQRHSLRHTVIPYVKASENEAQAWDHRVGHCVCTANRTMHPSVFPLEHHVCIGGLGGEVGRCFLWPQMDNLIPINAISIVDTLKLAREPRMIERVESWLKGIDHHDPYRLLDLAYIELRMSSWSSVQSYANPRSIVLHPLASFTAIAAMLSLPPEFRQNDGMISGFIERQWPDLLNLPINRYGNWRDLAKPLERATNPRKVYRKLRQIVRTRI